uniref:Uncharacterized protein n=1 Tax=Cacopsylla melanoneura TaxID=428564 RepID=A0A8D8XX21_9HEMI
MRGDLQSEVTKVRGEICSIKDDLFSAFARVETLINEKDREKEHFPSSPGLERNPISPSPCGQKSQGNNVTSVYLPPTPRYPLAPCEAARQLPLPASIYPPPLPATVYTPLPPACQASTSTSVTHGLNGEKDSVFHVSSESMGKVHNKKKKKKTLFMNQKNLLLHNKIVL